MLGPALWAAARLRVARWDLWRRDRAAVEARQLAILRAHCRRAADTELGRAHGLSAVRTHDDYVRRVPLRTYADFEPYFERMRQGARDVLWPGLIRHFAASSGTTGTAAAQKLLPISAEQIVSQQRCSFDIIARYMTLTGDRDLLRGYTIYLLPPPALKPRGPVIVTSNAGLMQLHTPFLARRIALPGSPIRDMADYDAKLTVIAESFLDHDVRSVSGTTCWFSVLFDRVLTAARARGRRASCIADVWPHLSVLFGGGVHAEPYRQIIRERVGRPVTLIDNYNATEGGLLAVTDSLEHDGMTPIADRGVFFEFVPRGEEGRPDAKRVPLWAVEPGGEYSVHVTTPSGLFGYSLGDYVRFESVFPHRLVFVGRVSGVLSLTQERTTYLEIENAVAAAQARHPCSIVDFAAAAHFEGATRSRGRYQLFVEFERPPDDLAGFTAAFDAQLCAQNIVYREHRDKDVAILPPELVLLTRGGARAFANAAGHGGAQSKFPRIVDERRRALLETYTERGSHAS